MALPGRVLLLCSFVWGGLVLLKRRLRASKSIDTPPRTRIVLKGQPLHSHGPDEVSVVSYNLLADQFALNTRMQHVHPDHLQWEHRRQLIVKELADLDADLVCLQEVDTHRWQELLGSSALSGRYQGLLQEKKGQSETQVVCAIMYRPERLELLWCEHRSRSLLAAFRFVDSYGLEQVLYVVNVHLEGSPYRPNDRVSQMRSSLQRLQQAQEGQAKADPRDCMVLVCGDFNSGRTESVWRLLHRGRLEGGTTEAHLPKVEVTRTTISHPYMLHDLYMTAGFELPFTRKVPTLGSTLDFIFASTDCDVSAVYWPLACRRANLDQLQRLSLPNHDHPSDHLPVGAVIRLKQPSPAAFRLYQESVAQEDQTG